jgi:hypothetical protein
LLLPTTFVHQKPTALRVIELELLHGSDFCGYPIRRIHMSKESRAAFPEQRCAPGSEFFGSVMLWLVCRVAPD